MYIRTLAYPVTVLGPGRRLGIWMAGCAKGCPGCMSVEMQRRLDSDEVSLDAICAIICERADRIDGVTISGGEPFEQAEELAALVAFLRREVTDDIVVYTGWTIDEVRANAWGARVLSDIATLIDGAYVEALNDGQGLRGSSNQIVHRLNPVAPFDYEHERRSVQGFIYEDRLFTVGLR